MVVNGRTGRIETIQRYLSNAGDEVERINDDTFLTVEGTVLRRTAHDISRAASGE